MTDIIGQLRDCVDRDDLPDWKLVLAAADRIEKLEAALRRISNMYTEPGQRDLTCLAMAVAATEVLAPKDPAPLGEALAEIRALLPPFDMGDGPCAA
ncbi:hypothetical protein UFOVP32_39 [uncultured Caudovirales phage]|uniref:Uncharacterized protein n=1 Tax=uncultured Caudovirales phage TaxID=2100421 RepID=A0A6J5KU09_9CAUD|nr:hypothetical protein UFOVP32_39 [uncultured Caudovirales phage]CAB4123660.1 hypothetical protein UFOVP50_37 [uncultured Caudovirales phage]